MGPYSGTPLAGTHHHPPTITHHPLPQAFQTVTVFADQNTPMQLIPVKAGSNEFKFDIFQPYTFFALQYIGEDKAQVKIAKIVRETLEIDPTPVYNVETESVVQPVVACRIYTSSGQLIPRLQSGVNVVVETMPDGQVRARKVIMP